MLDDLFCPTCNQIKFGPHHQCPPLFEVSYDGETFHAVRASDAENAAIAYAASFGSECPGEIYVRVADTIETYSIDMHLEPVYEATCICVNPAPAPEAGEE